MLLEGYGLTPDELAGLLVAYRDRALAAPSTDG